MTTRSEYQHDAAQWEYIATLWDAAISSAGVVCARRPVSGILMSGLCAAFVFTHSYWENEAQRERMEEQLRRRKPARPVKDSWPYWWPHTQDGANSRAAHCRRLAADCRRLAETINDVQGI